MALLIVFFLILAFLLLPFVLLIVCNIRILWGLALLKLWLIFLYRGK